MSEREPLPIYPAELAEPKKTPEMIDRVAKAICDAGIAWLQENDAKRQNLEWADVPDEVFARAAIEAMRVPTAAMVARGLELIQGNLRPDEIWPHMIDEARK